MSEDWTERWNIWRFLKQDIYSDPGLLGTSTSSPSWIFDFLVSVLTVIAGILSVHGLRAWLTNIWGRNQEPQDGNRKFEIAGPRGRRRLAEARSDSRSVSVICFPLVPRLAIAYNHLINGWWEIQNFKFLIRSLQTHSILYIQTVGESVWMTRNQQSKPNGIIWPQIDHLS